MSTTETGTDGTRADGLRRALDVAVYAIGVAMSLLVLHYANSLFVVRDRQANLVLGLSLALFYVVQARDALVDDSGAETPPAEADASVYERFVPARARAIVPRLDARLDGTGRRVAGALRRGADVLAVPTYLGLAVLALASMAYIEASYVRLVEDSLIVGFRPLDYLFGAVVIALSLDVTRRAFGNVLGGVIVAAVCYALAGPFLPGILYHSGMSPRQVVRVGILTMSGVFGFILEVGATWIAVFLLLAGFAKAYGVLDWVVDASQELGKLSRTGIVHVAVGASMVMGMITGSGAANTATTGSFTIPMMKRQGVYGEHAGAIEATASIGGQLVPPIMGVAAFIMADLLGIPYVDVIKAGLIPAFLFYFSIVVAVQLLVYKHGWTTERSRDLDWSVFADAVFYAVPFAVLLYFLVVVRYTPLTSGLYTVATMIGVALVKHLYESGAGGATDAARQTVEGLKQGAVDMAPLIAILASIGIAIGMFVRTGFAQRLATAMVGLSGQSILLLLVLAMIVSLLFGMGMPAPAAYILTASLAATAMVQLGIENIIAHMFVFYFAMYSSLTPPVGPSTVVGARIADADFIDTGKRAMQLALPGFLIPYAFVSNPTLVQWVWPSTAVVFAIAIVSVVGICVATFGFDGRNRVSVPRRLAYLGLALVGLFGSEVGLGSLQFLGTHTLQATAAVALVGAVGYARRADPVELELGEGEVERN